MRPECYGPGYPVSMMAWGIVGCEVLCVVHGAEGREGGPWHAADPLPCCWALQESARQFSHRADTGRAGQAHELHLFVSGKEGRYTHLEEFTEKRLLDVLPPKERKLWIAMRSEPSQSEVSDAVADLQDWATSVKATDKALVEESVASEASPAAGRVDSRKGEYGDIFGEATPAPCSPRPANALAFNMSSPRTRQF